MQIGCRNLFQYLSKHDNKLGLIESFVQLLGKSIGSFLIFPFQIDDITSFALFVHYLSANYCIFCISPLCLLYRVFFSFLKLFNNSGCDSFFFLTLHSGKRQKFCNFCVNGKLVYIWNSNASKFKYFSIPFASLVFVFAIYVFFKLFKTARHWIIFLENVILSFFNKYIHFRSFIILLKSKAC